MTEIEKMFENANIKQDRMCEWTCKDSETCNLNCKHYGSVQLYYPPFTAEKQLELIKWLAKIYELSINWNEHYCSYRFVTRDYKNGRLNHSVCNYEVPFEETLAYLINRIWQSLTDQEKEEIRSILNA